MFKPYYAPVSPRSRWLALLLCVLLGALGAHRFYTGKVGTGLLYLCTCGLFGLGLVWDAAHLLFGWFRDAYGLPLIY